MFSGEKDAFSNRFINGLDQPGSCSTNKNGPIRELRRTGPYTVLVELGGVEPPSESTLPLVLHA